MSNIGSISDLDSERYSIGILFRYPNIYTEISNFISENDYTSRLYKTLFSCIKECICEDAEATPYTVTSKIKSLGITFSELAVNEDLEGLLESIKGTPLNEKEGISHFKKIKTTTCRREIYQTAQNIAKAMKDSSEADISTLINLADKLYTERMGIFVKEGGQEFVNIFESLEQMIEERGNNPVTEFGFLGPWNEVNRIYDSLLVDSNITLIGARSNVGKSSQSFYYNIWVADKYNVPVLLLDSGEQTLLETQLRATCALTEGVAPMYHLTRGLWRRDKIMVEAVRKVWPRVQKLKYHYRNIGGMSADEIITTIRRFYLSQVGRIKQPGMEHLPSFVINYDYLKPIQSDNPNSPEWAEMGHFMQKLKTLITTDVPCPVWMPIQLNRSGITRGKKMGDYDDSEGAISISDRLFQQASQVFLLRNKTMDELSYEESKWGNCVFKNIKRRSLGEGFRDALTPVRMEDGSLKENHIHLNQDSFHWKEMGTLAQSVNSVKGQKYVDDDTVDDSDILLK